MTALPGASPGMVVRVRLSAGLCYSSKRLTAAEATLLAEETERALKAQNGGWGFVGFDDAHTGRVFIRAQKVVAIEVRPVTPVVGP